MAAAAAAAARAYLPSPYLPNFPSPYRHPLFPFTTQGYNPAAASFHTLLAGLSRPKLDEYQNLLNAAAAAGLPPPPVTTPPATSVSPPVSSAEGNKISSNPGSPKEDDRKAESINILRMKAREHEAKIEGNVSPKTE